jgi:hypothetical protein
VEASSPSKEGGGDGDVGEEDGDEVGFLPSDDCSKSVVDTITASRGGSDGESDGIEGARTVWDDRPTFGASFSLSGGDAFTGLLSEKVTSSSSSTSSHLTPLGNEPMDSKSRAESSPTGGVTASSVPETGSAEEGAGANGAEGIGDGGGGGGEGVSAGKSGKMTAETG